jgi:Zn-dependent oligopeptidase
MRFKNRTFQSYNSKATSVFNKLTEIANANDLPLPWEEHLDSAVEHKFQDLLNAWSDSVNQIRDGPNTNYICKLSAFKCSILTIWNFIHGMGSRVQSKEVGSKRKRSISTNMNQLLQHLLKRLMLLSHCWLYAALLSRNLLLCVSQQEIL